MTRFVPYPPGPEVVGTLLVARDAVVLPAGGRRDLWVHLPETAGDGDRRYPVVYVHDGQNLFDPAASHAGAWEFDAAMATLAADGIEAVVVGVENAGDARVDEYGPWRHRGMGGGGAAYVNALVDVVKPLIDTTFPTRDDRAGTGLLGSSMGGVISLFGYVTRPDVFGFAGVFSPAFLYAPGWSHALVESSGVAAGRIYLDVGTAEYPDDPERSATYVADARAMRDLLLAKGLGEGLRYVEEQGAVHHETAWARRLPDALRFLLGPAQG